MRFRSAFVLAALISSIGVAAQAATDEDALLGVLKKFGIGLTSATSKKPCLCSGGSFGGLVGRLAVFKTGSGGYQFDCGMTEYDANGSVIMSGGCVLNGGSLTVIGK